MLRRLLLAAALALIPSFATAQFATIAPTPATTDNGDRIATTAWVNNLVNVGMPLAAGKIWIGSAGNIATVQTPSGDLTVSQAGVFTFGAVNANVGTFGSSTNCVTLTVNAKGLITAASQAACAGGGSGITQLTGDVTAGPGSGSQAATLASIITAAGPIGSATVAPIITYDAKGRVTTVTSATITPAIGSITGVATGCGTWLATATSANLRGCLTDESGNGLAYFQGGDLGTPSAGVLTNASGTAASLTAGNATKLATARAIGITGSTGLTATGVNFDGSAAINMTLTGTLAVANGGTGDTGTAWSTYTPSVTAQTGTCTTCAATGRYKQIGKTVFLEIDATVTTVGSATGALFASLPLTAAANNYVGSGYERALTGTSGAAVILGASPTSLNTRGAGGATFFASGNAVTVGIIYELP